MPMQVILAGYNIDRDIIDDIKSRLKDWQDKLDPKQLSALKGEALHEIAAAVYRELKRLNRQDNLTPETLSAAYARISRNPAPVNELRKIAREEIDKARKSNKTIIFGLGHSSVAEHAVFNIDIIGVSRYIVEEIEKFRLNAYTEKSQRYILLEDDYVVPEEIKKSGHAELFENTIRQQNKMYFKLYDRLLPYVLEVHPDLAKDKKNTSLLEGLAKEDARYIMPLAAEAQLGMTANARNLELMLSRTASHPLAEVREFSKKLYDEVVHIAPSVIKYPEATDYFTHGREEVKKTAKDLLNKLSPEMMTTEKDHPYSLKDVSIWQFTPHPHVLIAASLLYAEGSRSMQDCIHAAMQLTPEDIRKLYYASWQRMESWDTVLREFENVSILYEITLSASCFGQMKRHRMTSQHLQPYDPALDVTIPFSISAVGMENEFRELIAQIDDVYCTLQKAVPLAAPYILTNAHRRRMLLQVNARELYHISRLREDKHAQWDIRNIAGQMTALAQQAVPVIFDFACGKDSFDDRRRELFEKEE
ncbi:FAD-dependent thymidylate synthase [candidate division KSB1 bacterium]